MFLGATRDAGQHLLEACNGDLEMAIGMQMDGSADGITATSTADQTGDQQQTTGGATGSLYVNLLMCD